MGLFVFAGRDMRAYMYLEMRNIRHITTFFLIAVLALTAQSMAVARGTAMSAGQIVLCTGTGPVVVDVDKDGQPVDPAHICPECAVSELVALDGPAFTCAATLGVSKAQPAAHRLIVINALRHPAAARDPPLV